MNFTMKLVVLFFSLLILTTTAYSESPREQLKQMVEQLQKNPTDNALREKIIKLAQELKPAPAVPEEARRYRARGIAAFEIAKSPEDFKLALPEFQNAADVAPWWSDTYFNLAKVQEKTGDLKGAIGSYHFYLAADPKAKDAESIRTQSYKLEYMAEQMAKKDKAIAEQKAKEDEAKAKEESVKRQRQAWAAEIVQWLTNNYGGRVEKLHFADGMATNSNNGRRFQYSIIGNNMDQIQILEPWQDIPEPYCGIPINSDIRSVKWRYCGRKVEGFLLDRTFNFTHMKSNSRPGVEASCSTCNLFVYQLEP